MIFSWFLLCFRIKFYFLDLFFITENKLFHKMKNKKWKISKMIKEGFDQKSTDTEKWTKVFFMNNCCVVHVTANTKTKFCSWIAEFLFQCLILCRIKKKKENEINFIVFDMRSFSSFCFLNFGFFFFLRILCKYCI